MKSRHFPHLATIFFLGTIAVALLSWIGRVYGASSVQSLLNSDGIRWELKNAVSNYMQQPALGIIMILFIGLGLTIYSGFFETIKKSVLRQSLTRKEKRSLFLSLITLLIYIITIALITFSPFAILKSVTGTLVNSPFEMGLFYIISFSFGLTGLVYGYISGKYRSDRDIIKGMTFLYRRCSDYFIILFFVVQFFASLIYSNMLQSMGVSEESLYFVFDVFCYLPIVQIIKVEPEKKASKK